MLSSLPAINLAEAMQHMPGIAISRDRGEGLSVTALGLGAQYQQVLFNERRIANTENVRNSTQLGQAFRFDTLLPQAFYGVEVVKSPTANARTGHLGASVNLLSFQPLAREDSSH